MLNLLAFSAVQKKQKLTINIKIGVMSICPKLVIINLKTKLDN